MSASCPITLRHIFLSPGHNYFGHHGQDPGEHPIVEVDTVECVEGRGLKGDRFFDYKEDYKGQATFFAWETYLEMCKALEVKDRPPSACRRNIFTEGIDLNGLSDLFAKQGPKGTLIEIENQKERMVFLVE